MDYERKIAEKIRAEYEEKKPGKLEELRELDARVKGPARVFAYLFGTLGALVLGTGMCLAMKVIGDMMAAGIAIGCVGILMVSVNYKLYRTIVEKRKKKYGAQILAVTNELLGE